MNFLKAKPGRPPLREYKQSMAKQARPLPGPVKRKLDKNGLENFGLSYPWESLPIQHSEKAKYPPWINETILENTLKNIF